MQLVFGVRRVARIRNLVDHLLHDRSRRGAIAFVLVIHFRQAETEKRRVIDLPLLALQRMAQGLNRRRRVMEVILIDLGDFHPWQAVQRISLSRTLVGLDRTLVIALGHQRAGLRHHVLLDHLATIVNRVSDAVREKRQQIDHHKNPHDAGSQEGQQDAAEGAVTIERGNFAFQRRDFLLGIALLLKLGDLLPQLLHFTPLAGKRHPAARRQNQEHRIENPFQFHDPETGRIPDRPEAKTSRAYSRRALRPSSMSFQKCFEFANASSSATGIFVERNRKSENVPLCSTRCTITASSFTSK